MWMLSKVLQAFWAQLIHLMVMRSGFLTRQLMLPLV